MAQVDPSIVACVRRLKERAFSRDTRMQEVRAVRKGQMQDLWPAEFSEKYPKAMIANLVDVVARDLAEVIAPLPTLQCSVGAMKTDADKRRAERKNRIGGHYWRTSRLDAQMFYGADQYNTYAFLPGVVELDTRNRRPRIKILDPVGCYYQLDRNLDVQYFAREWTQSTDELCAQFPEAEHAICVDYKTGEPFESTETTVVHYIDGQNVTLYLPDRYNLVLASYAHRMSTAPVRVALRPGLDMEPQGQFDDVLWVQLARAKMAQLTLEAATKAVEAPITVPNDVVELNIGPDAILQTDHGEQVRRVSLEVPAAAFAMTQQLDNEAKIGARYPDARLGQAQASVITGKGVQALMGGFDTQIKSAQSILGRFLGDLTELAFEMDEKWWPTKRERVTGTIAGRSYELVYTPRKDIAGDYSCDITYGFASGMSPQNALIAMLQARGDGLVGRDFVRRNMPWGIDSDQEQRDLDVQELEDGYKQGILAALQASGQMMAAGQTQMAMLWFQIADDAIKGRQNGKPINEVVMSAITAFQQQQQEQAQQAQAAQAQAGAPGGGGDSGGGIPGVGPDGLPPNVAPGQAGLAPGGLPDVQSLIAGFRGGQGVLDSSVRRRLPVG